MKMRGSEMVEVLTSINCGVRTLPVQGWQHLVMPKNPFRETLPMEKQTLKSY